MTAAVCGASSRSRAVTGWVGPVASAEVTASTGSRPDTSPSSRAACPARTRESVPGRAAHQHVDGAPDEDATVGAADRGGHGRRPDPTGHPGHGRARSPTCPARPSSRCVHRGMEFYTRRDGPSRTGVAPDSVDGWETGTAAFAEWERHLDRVLPELAVHDLARQLADVQQRLWAAVHAARLDGLPASYLSAVARAATGDVRLRRPSRQRTAATATVPLSTARSATTAGPCPGRPRRAARPARSESARRTGATPPGA
jgi:hypothetical protein